MLSFDRHQEILQLLEKRQSMTVKRLAELIHTSEATMRRDLVSLEKQGFVNRVYGGVVLSKYCNIHMPLSARQQENKLAKAQIAAKAVKMIPDGSIIILDGSSTCQMMLPHLKNFQKLTIISHSIGICEAALEMNHTVYCVGGALNPQDCSNLGHYAERMVSLLHADILFFSCSGLSLQGELTGIFEPGVSYLHAAMRRADRCYFLCDSTKLGKTFQYHLAMVSDVDEILCDIALPSEIRQQIGVCRPNGAQLYSRGETL